MIFIKPALLSIVIKQEMEFSVDLIWVCNSSSEFSLIFSFR